ncbi:MAG: DNA-3-methyladenine glycosylase [bacterium]
MRLNKEFYKQDAVTVAENLVGKLLVRKLKGKEIICRIVETEAYRGIKDKGSHAYNNRRTARTEMMYKEGGHAYIYLIYGMYYCFNVVTNEKECPDAVLIRAVEPLTTLDIIKENRKIKSKKLEDLTNGPGKLCQALAIDKSFNYHNLIKSDQLYIIKDEKEKDKDKNKEQVIADKRINIDYAEEYKDKMWRFYLKDNSFVST